MKKRRWRQRFTHSAILAICSALGAAEAHGQESLAQMYHRGWTVREGAPNNIENAIQGGDGFIWLTTDDGLYRFDGVKFERYRPPVGNELLSPRQNAIMAARDGSLWISYMLGGVTRIQGNSVKTFTEKDGLRSGHIGIMAEDKDERIWAYGTNGLQFISNDKVTQVHGSHAEGDLDGEELAVDQEGNLWITPWSHGVFVLPRGASDFIRASKDPYHGCRPAHKAGVLCHIEGHPMAHFSLADGKISSNTLLPGSSRIYDQLAEKDGTIWVGTGHDGVQRFRAGSDFLAPKEHPVVETFSREQGLTGREAQVLFEDREGSVWVVSDRGIDQFRIVPFRRVELNFLLGSLPANGIWPRFLVGTDRLVDLTSGAPVPLFKENADIGGLRCLFRSDDGTTWIGGIYGLGHYSDGRIKSIPLPETIKGTRQIIQTIVEDSSHGIWVSIGRKGLYRLGDQGWLRLGGLSDLPTQTAYASLRDHEGNLWFGFLHNLLVRLDSGKVTRFDQSTGLDIGDIRVLSERAGQVWVGGEKGIAVLRDGQFRAVHLNHAQAVLGVTGMVFLPSGDLWINAASGAFRISRQQLSSWDKDTGYSLDWTRFDYLDGIDGIPMPLSGNPSAAVAADGKLYLATNWGVQWTDPSHISTNAVKPPVWITDIKTPSEDFAPDGQTIRLSPDPKSLTIDYSAPSLLIPERVRFRYRLVGFDSDWTEAGTTRRASYTRLPPGKYTFHVVACNDAGVWNMEGASLEFTVAPTITETLWFRLALVAALIALAFASFRIRLARGQRRVADQMYEILSERQRIARDLHDTFLQSVQMILFKVAIAARKLPIDNPVRPILEETMAQSDEVLLDGRRLISNLQVQEESSASLTKALRAIIHDLEAVYPSIHLAFEIQGAERLLNPFVQQELSVIGREALTNAARHAGAANIWLTLQIDPDYLRLMVRDDGHGIEDDVLAQGHRAGHWGLRNMRKRADRLGGRFNLKSSRTNGTLVEVLVPAFLAYKDTLGGLREKLRRIWG